MGSDVSAGFAAAQPHLTGQPRAGKSGWTQKKTRRLTGKGRNGKIITEKGIPADGSPLLYGLEVTALWE